MKLYYERIWDYEIDEQKIIKSINLIKTVHFIDMSLTQLHRYSEHLAKKYIEEQLHTDVRTLPHQLIKPVITLIYNELKKRKDDLLILENRAD